MNTQALLSLAALVFVAVSFVVVGDTAGKLLTARGVDPIFIAWTRFGLGALLVLPFSGLRLAEFAQFKDWRIILRAAFITGGIACILTALRSEPIANVFGAFFIGPIVSYILAVIFLGERPSVWRGMLLLLGFIGVMLVVKPGFGASVGMSFGVMAGVFYGAYLAMTRVLAGTYRPRFVLLSQLIIGTVLLAPLGVQVALPDFAVSLWALIVLSAAASACGNFMLVLASKKAEASLVAPLAYSQLFTATMAGLLVFGDWPDGLALIGLVCILISGFGSLILHQKASLMQR